MIKQFTDFPGNVVAFACQGRVTKADYDGSSRSSRSVC
jgi:hypothetical protein